MTIQIPVLVKVKYYFCKLFDTFYDNGIDDTQFRPKPFPLVGQRCLVRNIILQYHLSDIGSNKREIKKLSKYVSKC